MSSCAVAAQRAEQHRDRGHHAEHGRAPPATARTAGRAGPPRRRRRRPSSRRGSARRSGSGRPSRPAARCAAGTGRSCRRPRPAAAGSSAAVSVRRRQPWASTSAIRKLPAAHAEQRDAEQEADVADPGDQERLHRGARAPRAAAGRGRSAGTSRRPSPPSRPAAGSGRRTTTTSSIAPVNRLTCAA